VTPASFARPIGRDSAASLGPRILGGSGGYRAISSCYRGSRARRQLRRPALRVLVRSSGTKPLKTSSATATDAPSTTAKPSPIGLAASGPVAAVRQCFDLINEAQVTGDVSAMRQASAPECDGCKGVADYIGGIYERGGRYQGDFKVRITDLIRTPESDPPAVTVFMGRNSYELIRKAGAKPTPMPDQKTVWASRSRKGMADG
jgi:hypothetical protein